MSHQRSSNKDWFFWLLILAIFSMIALGQFSAWKSQPDGSRLVKMAEIGAATLAAAGVILATYISYKQSKNRLAGAAEEKARNKLEETFRLIEKWDDPHFLSPRKLSVALGRERSKLSPQELIDKVEDDLDLRSSISLMLNYFDFIRLSIKYERINSEIIKQQLGPVILLTLDRFDAWIKTRDKMYLDDIDELRKLMMR
ncbi:hypothetical protein DUD43_09165 [Alcaligenes faecalis]|uniref:DUF4760 domain-containing protein n=1 Tax=Alcaligenes faecalis TaxID=511 RepID=UPI0012931051|nr:hypothetical protein [Alcaligenes faecalis]QFY77840.1 hypothetical protein DUD43_09165 [Alcaligenes faecalis]